MIARSTQTAVTFLAVTLLGLTLPQAAQARDHDRDSHSYGYQHVDHRDRGYGNDDGPRYDRHRYNGRDHHQYYRYAPRYYPDVVVYPEPPRVYYSAPYYAEPAYPREYGNVGIHLDYNLLY